MQSLVVLESSIPGKNHETACAHHSPACAGQFL